MAHRTCLALISSTFTSKDSLLKIPNLVSFHYVRKTSGGIISLNKIFPHVSNGLCNEVLQSFHPHSMDADKLICTTHNLRTHMIVKDGLLILLPSCIKNK